MTKNEEAFRKAKYDQAIGALEAIHAHFDGMEELPPWGEELKQVAADGIAAAQSAPVVDVEALKRDCKASIDENIHDEVDLVDYIVDYIFSLPLTSGYLKTPSKPIEETIVTEIMLNEARSMIANFDLHRLSEKYGGEERWNTRAKELIKWAESNLEKDLYEALAATFEGVLVLDRLYRGQKPPPPVAIDLAALERAINRIDQLSLYIDADIALSKPKTSMYLNTLGEIRALLNNAIAAQKGQ